MEYVMMQSPTIAKLGDALSKAQAAMKPAKKDAENPFFKSHYADLSSVWEAIRGPLSANGLAVAQMPTVGPDGVQRLRTLLIHSSGEWIGSDLDMKPVKNDPQSIGSCLTYARRYALSAITGVATEDDDGNAAAQPDEKQPAEKPKPVFRTVTTPAPASDVPPEGQFIWRVGKEHKGKPIDEIPLDYLDWYARQGTLEDHRKAAQKALDWANAQTALPEEALPELDQ